jgi:uncharacterized protein (TIGR02147 family)
MNEQLAIQQKVHDTFLQLRSRNAAFSLRAFARKLGLNPSALSEILQGKRRVSKKMAQRILLRICTSPKEAEQILALFPEGTVTLKAAAVTDQTRYSILPIDQFQTIASWHHFAIHSLIATKDFKADPNWIAKRLGLKTTEAEAALERLERVGMIAWDRRRKKMQQKRTEFSTPEDVANTAVRIAHNEDLENARRKIEEIAIELREFTSITMGIDTKKIPTAKKMIREFRDKLSDFLESGPKTEVYRMCFHLFPLSIREDQS